MNKFKIIKTFLRENKNSDLVTRLYLLSDYLQNLKQIKRMNKLGKFDIIFNYKVPKEPSNSVNKNKFNVHTNDNLPDLEKELEEIKLKMRQERIERVINYFKKIAKYSNIKHLFDLKNSQDNIQKLFAFLSEYIGIYKRSLQELVEGQREVTQKKNFKFEDGQTVQEKMDKFEAKVKEHLNIKNQFNKFQNKH